MMFKLRILGKPDGKGNAPVVDNRVHGGNSVEEAIRTAKQNLLNSPPPNAYGFSLLDNSDIEVHRWFNTPSDA
jgi:hypothetical protein